MIEEVRTERLTLRPLTADDRAEFLRVHTVSYDFFKPWYPTREESLESLFEKELEKNRADGRHFRWIGTLSNGQLAGFFNLFNIVRGVFQNAYASWSVSVEHAGQGLASEGVQGLLDLAFSEREGLGLHRIQANIMPSNEPSLRLASKVGLRKEGEAKRYLKIDGIWQDHWIHAKTVEEHSLLYLSS